MSSSADDWPLVGRSEELDHLRRLRSGSRPFSAFITGPPASASRGWRARRSPKLRAKAGRRWSSGAAPASRPCRSDRFGRCSASRPAELAELTESVTNELVAMRSAKGCSCWVDDCQDLDEALGRAAPPGRGGRPGRGDRHDEGRHARRRPR